MSNKLKIAIKVVTFVVIFAAISFVLTSIFTPKDITDNYRSTSTIVNFYQEPKDSLDVLFIGTSAVAHGVSPMEIWQEYGIPSYSLAIEQQAPITSYYLLKEALKYQNLKIVVLGSSYFFENINYDDRAHVLRKTLDYMPLSPLKIQEIAEIVANSEKQTFLNYLFPLSNYHTRWESLNASDFRKVTEEYSYKGADVCYEVVPCEFPVNFMQPGDNEIIELNEIGRSYLERIIQLCKDQNTELVLIAMPRPSWSYEKNHSISEIATQFHIPFIDYNLAENREAISFDEQIDYYDSGHLNAYGAEKISAHLGSFLIDTFDLDDRRDDPNYAKWFDDLEYYNQEELAYKNGN